MATHTTQSVDGPPGSIDRQTARHRNGLWRSATDAGGQPTPVDQGKHTSVNNGGRARRHRKACVPQGTVGSNPTLSARFAQVSEGAPHALTVRRGCAPGWLTAKRREIWWSRQEFSGHAGEDSVGDVNHSLSGLHGHPSAGAWYGIWVVFGGRLQRQEPTKLTGCLRPVLSSGGLQVRWRLPCSPRQTDPARAAAMASAAAIPACTAFPAAATLLPASSELRAACRNSCALDAYARASRGLVERMSAGRRRGDITARILRWQECRGPCQRGSSRRGVCPARPSPVSVEALAGLPQAAR